MMQRCRELVRAAAFLSYLPALLLLLYGCGGMPVGDSGAATCTYFIDAAAGDDGHSGSSPEKAWASGDRAVAHTRSPNARAGDVICFKRGQRFVISNGRLGSSGSADQPVIIKAYGDPIESAPRLSSSIRIDTRSEWVSLGNGIFYLPYTDWNASNLWRGGIWQRPATDQFLNNGNWYHRRGHGIFLRLPRDPVTSGEIYLDIQGILFGVHGLHHIDFQDLVFEYTGATIYGRPVSTESGQAPSAIAYLRVLNSRFEHVNTGVLLFSETVDGNAYENHHVDIVGNQFEDIRFAVHLGSLTNGPERHRHITIARNSIRMVAKAGSYIGGASKDIEAIGLQNTTDTYIMDNRIEDGLKLEEGVTNTEGVHLFSAGITIWRSPAAILERVRVERNYIKGLGRGIDIGAGVEDAMRNVIVTNNIILNCDVGLKSNGSDTSQTYHVRFNTLFQNGANLYIDSGGSQAVTNNFSVEPREYHLISTGMNMKLNYNAYVPNGRFLFHNVANPALDILFEDFLSFQARWNFDKNSFTENVAGFTAPAPHIAEDFQLTALSPARARGVAIGLEDRDFGGRARLPGSVDIGAWAHNHPETSE